MRSQPFSFILCFFAIGTPAGLLRAGDPMPAQATEQTMTMPFGPPIQMAPVAGPNPNWPTGPNSECATCPRNRPLAHWLGSHLAPSRPRGNPCPGSFKTEWMFLFSSSREFFGDPCLKQPPEP
jgi:hypothetical protein